MEDDPLLVRAITRRLSGLHVCWQSSLSEQSFSMLVRQKGAPFLAIVDYELGAGHTGRDVVALLPETLRTIYWTGRPDAVTRRGEMEVVLKTDVARLVTLVRRHALTCTGSFER